MNKLNINIPFMILLFLVNFQVQSADIRDEDILPIVDASNFITRTSICHTLAHELSINPGINLPEISQKVFTSLSNSGWSQDDIATALTWSQNALPDVPSHPDETRAQYMTRLYNTKFECNKITKDSARKIAASIPEKSNATE